MTRIVAGAAIEAGECGNDDVTAANLARCSTQGNTGSTPRIRMDETR